MMITKLFILTHLEKNFKQRLRHQVVEVEAVQAKVIQKLLLPHPWLEHLTLKYKR